MRDTHSDPYGDLGTGSCCALDIQPQADPRVWDSPVPQTIINVTCICPATSISPAAVRCCHHTIASRCWLPMPGAFPGCRITAQLPFSCRIYTPVLGFPAKFHYYICSFLRLVIKHSGHGLHRYAGDIPVSQNGAPGRLLSCFICSSVLLMSRCSWSCGIAPSHRLPGRAEGWVEGWAEGFTAFTPAAFTHAPFTPSAVTRTIHTLSVHTHSIHTCSVHTHTHCSHPQHSHTHCSHTHCAWQSPQPCAPARNGPRAPTALQALERSR